MIYKTRNILNFISAFVGVAIMAFLAIYFDLVNTNITIVMAVAIIIFFPLNLRMVVKINSADIFMKTRSDSGRIDWDEIMKVEYKKGRRTVVVHDKNGQKMGLYKLKNIKQLWMNIYEECVKRQKEDCFDLSFIDLINQLKQKDSKLTNG